jgi:beta-lactam-binding protein with PASTA domain
VPPFADGEMPDFHGVEREAAEALLDELGVRFVVVEVANAAPAGRVFAQTPEPGAQLDPDATLVVSSGPAD